MAFDVSDSPPTRQTNLGEGRINLALDAFPGPKSPGNTVPMEGTSIAQAGKDDLAAANKAIEEADSASKFTRLPKNGALGFIAEAGKDGVAPYAPGMVDTDKAWTDPYNEMTEFDGHRLLDRHKNSHAVIRLELTRLDSEKQIELGPTISKFTDPKAEITADMVKELEPYPELRDALVEYHTASRDPNIDRAYSLNRRVRKNLGDSIQMRQAYKDMTTEDKYQGMRIGNGMNMYAAFLAFDYEMREMERYK